MGTMHTMSAQNSDHKEAACWGESSTKAQHKESLSTWAEENIPSSSSVKLRWSIGMGKKEDWDGRAKGVIFTRAAGNREVETFHNDYEMEEVPAQSNYLMKQAMSLMREALQTMQVQSDITCAAGKDTAQEEAIEE